MIESMGGLLKALSLAQSLLAKIGRVPTVDELWCYYHGLNDASDWQE
jgi:hypothetical protein